MSGDTMLFRPLLPSSVLLAEMPPDRADPAQLRPAEYRLIERAVPKRQREFAAGRVLAHSLFGELNVTVPALLSDADRVPMWPEAIIGSITHCGSLCAVAIAGVATSAGIGIDVEPARPLSDELLPQVLRPGEYGQLMALPPSLRPLGGILVFSIKEAVYKAIYPRRRVFLDFNQVEIAFEGEDGFVAEVLVPGAGLPELPYLRGRYRVADGHLAAAVVLPPTS
jgi:4'-phosphopantetheinyl transferase EntD